VFTPRGEDGLGAFLTLELLVDLDHCSAVLSEGVSGEEGVLHLANLRP
jgi:hypothetical protein